MAAIMHVLPRNAVAMAATNPAPVPSRLAWILMLTVHSLSAALPFSAFSISMQPKT
jgi:hypothetical protein